MLGYLLNRLLSLATLVLLARQLAPSDFGLVSLALVFVTGATLVAGAGYYNAMIEQQDLSDAGRSAVFGAVTLSGFVVGALVIVTAKPLAVALDQPGLAAILVVLSTTVLFGGVTGFYEASLQADLEFKSQFVCRLWQSVCFSIVGLIAAWSGAGVWSLVAAQSSSWLTYTLLLVYLAPRRYSPRFDRRVLRGMRSSARGFLAQGLSGYFANSADYFFIGRSIGVGDLGFYSMAYRLSDITYWAIAEPVSKATFPGFARMRHRGEGTREALYRVTRTVTITACPAGVILSAVAGPFTLTVFGSKWGAMINALAILGVWAAVRPYSTTLGWYLLAVGHAKVVGVISIIVVVPQVVALGTAASLGGIEEVAWVMVCSSGVSAMIWSVLAVRSTAVTAADLVKAVRPVVLACGAAWIGAHAATKPFASRPAVSLVLATMVGATSYLFTVRIVEPDALSQAARRVRRVVSFGE